MTRRDLERYVRSKTGAVTPGERDRRLDAIVRYRETPTDPGNPYGRGFRLRPGFQAGDTSLSTSFTSGRTLAFYLGQAPDDLNLITIRVNVTTAVSAGGFVWAEVGIATCLDLVMGSGSDLIPEGSTAVGSTFNTTGIKDTEVAVNIAAGAHCFALLGSQATTPYQVTRSDIGDPLAMGWYQLLDGVQPSTMPNPSTFAVSTTGGNNAWIGYQW